MITTEITKKIESETDQIQAHWSQVVDIFHQIGPPMRPHEQDISIYEALIRQATANSDGHMQRSVLFGVTPEIATLHWPENMELLAVDKSPPMLAQVWPGDVPGIRSSQQGDWLDLPVEEGKIDLVIGDGCFTLQRFPDGYHALSQSILTALRPGGHLLMRFFVRPDVDDFPTQVFSDLDNQRVSSVEVFKWRLAMALTTPATPNIRVDSVWHVWNEANISSESRQTLSGRVSIDRSLDYYRDSKQYLSFPDLAQVFQTIGTPFELVSIVEPQYELGERCPIILFKKPQ